MLKNDLTIAAPGPLRHVNEKMPVIGMSSLSDLV
jgi:hypothetical protein